MKHQVHQVQRNGHPPQASASASTRRRRVAIAEDPEVQFKKSLAALEGTVIVESMVFGNYDFDSGRGAERAPTRESGFSRE